MINYFENVPPVQGGRMWGWGLVNWTRKISATTHGTTDGTTLSKEVSRKQAVTGSNTEKWGLY